MDIAFSKVPVHVEYSIPRRITLLRVERDARKAGWSFISDYRDIMSVAGCLAVSEAHMEQINAELRVRTETLARRINESARGAYFVQSTIISGLAKDLK